jgi:3-phenylpropionate/trans-cinnamate dioxygenase ferredoxin reductase subunit
VPLSHAVGEEAGTILTEYHKGQGVEFRPEATFSSIEGKGKAERVHLKSGEKLECDNVVIGAGVIARTEIAEGTDIKIDKGILVDEFCQTSVEGIFAAGDVTRFYHPVLKNHIHIEHWENARMHGMAAAKNMLGRRVAYSPAPFFWSDQYDLNIQYVGFPLPWDNVVFRGDLEEHSFSVFLLAKGGLVAAVCFRRWRDRRACERLIQKGIKLDPEKLADEAFELENFEAVVR